MAKPIISQEAQRWIETLGLLPHPEGGFYREMYRSDETLAQETLPSRYKGPRQFGTSIHYLLSQGTRSVFHRLLSDEIWYFQTGGPVAIIQISPQGDLIQTVMGTNPAQGHVLQLLIPRGHYFAAHPLAESPYSLVSCAVFPGFDFADFELTDKAALLAQYPQHTEWIERLGAIRGG